MAPTTFHSSTPTEKSRAAAAMHALKVAGASARRLLKDALDSSVVRHPKRPVPDIPQVAESTSRLWNHDAPGEWVLEAGKVENLRRAANLLDGTRVPAGGVFSFWKQVGRATRRRGFVEGREILQGCVVPSIGGGLCQLSNALYDAALQADLDIIERYRHSKIVPGSMAEDDRDATLFWPHIDLRFGGDRAFWIKARLTDTELVVRIYSHQPPAGQRPPRAGAEEPSTVARNQRPHTAKRKCLNCNEVECFRYWKHRELADHDGARTAFLLDAHWPEFDRFVRDEARAGDLACVPMPDQCSEKTRYSWRLRGLEDVRHVAAVTALRGLHTRTLATQGAERQRALLDWDRVMAEHMARHLERRITRVVVSQNLLPFLWEAGHLQGRRFEVLMQRHPISELHRRLDAAARLHPDSPTLGDFRAPRWLVEAESAALEAAHRLITPHSAIARLYPGKSKKLDWQMPQPSGEAATQSVGRMPVVVFPASTVGRKGAYELREALERLEIDVELRVLGAQLEGADFWRGRRVHSAGPDDVEAADVVVLPAHIEHRPRLLLRAAAAGVPVVASRACGMGGVAGIEEVAAGDAGALCRALRAICGRGKDYGAAVCAL